MMLNRSGEKGHPCLDPSFRGRASSFSPLRMMLHWFIQLTPVHGGQGETSERGSPLQIVMWQVKKQGNLLTRLVLCHCKMSRSLHPPTGILKVYVEALMGFRLSQKLIALSSLCP